MSGSITGLESCFESVIRTLFSPKSESIRFFKSADSLKLLLKSTIGKKLLAKFADPQSPYPPPPENLMKEICQQRRRWQSRFCDPVRKTENFFVIVIYMAFNLTVPLSVFDRRSWRWIWELTEHSTQTKMIETTIRYY